MAYTFEQFCRDCHSAIKADPGPDSRDKIRDLVEQILENEEFVQRHLGASVPEGRHTLYEDPELKFCVLAHIDRSPRASMPHDHGRSWAVYGQAVGWSHMGIWKRQDGGTGAGPAEVVETKSYRLAPGEAGIFDVGDIHSVERSPGDCCYLRVTGEDLERVPRLKYDLNRKRAIQIESAGVGAA